MAKKPTAYILHEGISQLDGVTPIVVIATGLQGGTSKNGKTGTMVQSFILRSDLNPIEALKTGKDSAICGTCPLRAGACYVNVAKSVLQVWKKYARGGYTRMAPDDFGVLLSRTGQGIRLGSYGDPTAVPFEVWKEILDFSGTFSTGYTHSWARKEFQAFNQIVMASCETPVQAAFAASKGFRSFLVTPTAEVPQGFVRCPASKEHEKATGRKLSCDKCRICNGKDGKFSRNVAIRAHGGKVQERSATRLLLALNAQ